MERRVQAPVARIDRERRERRDERDHALRRDQPALHDRLLPGRAAIARPCEHELPRARIRRAAATLVCALVVDPVLAEVEVQHIEVAVRADGARRGERRAGAARLEACTGTPHVTPPSSERVMRIGAPRRREAVDADLRSLQPGDVHPVRILRVGDDPDLEHELPAEHAPGRRQGLPAVVRGHDPGGVRNVAATPQRHERHVQRAVGTEGGVRRVALTLALGRRERRSASRSRHRPRRRAARTSSAACRSGWRSRAGAGHAGCARRSASCSS